MVPSRPIVGNGTDRRDHRLSRPLHDRAESARRLAQPADRRHRGSRRRCPRPAELKISDDELRESIESQPAQDDAASAAATSRSSARAPASWRTTSATSRPARPGPRSATSCATASPGFSRTTSSARRCCRSRRASIPKTCIPELEKCVKEYGFVGINLNPDPSGGHWTSPPLSDRHWYPIYEKMVEFDIPAMIHVSTSCNAVLPHHRRALPERRHHRLHAVPDLGPVQGFPDAALRDPAWRRRGALSLGPLPRPGAGAEEAAAEGSSAEQHLLRHLRLSPAGHRPADAG